VGAEQNSTIVFPVPIDVLEPFVQSLKPKAEKK